MSGRPSGRETIALRLRRPGAAWLLICFLLAPGAVWAQVVQPVQDLQCSCKGNVDQRGEAILTWTDPTVAPPFLVEVMRDGVVVFVIGGEPGKQRNLLDPGLDLGFHRYVLTVISGNRRSPGRECTVDCLPIGVNTPHAVIEGPERLILPDARRVEAIFDGRKSIDSRGGRALRFNWKLDGPNGPRVESPAASVTQVFFPGPGTYQLLLTVVEEGDPSQVNTGFLVVSVEDPAVGEPAQFFPPPQDLLVAVAGRPFEFPLMATSGFPYPRLKPADGDSTGILVDPALGRIVWVPPLALAGKLVQEKFSVDTQAGQTSIVISIQVIFPGTPISMYAFPLPKPGAGAVKGDGGGASLSAAPLTIEDQSAFEPDLDLELLPFSAGEDCSIQLIEAGGADPFDGLLFDPGCAAGASGLYFSASAGQKITDTVTNDFTVELFLSQVGAAPPPLGPAFVFSMSQGTTGVNWLIRHDGGPTFSAVVNTGGPAISAAAAPDRRGLIHLVFVRAGSEHRLYVNGTRAATAAGPATLTWDPNFMVFLGNSEDETRPFDGRIHFVAFYGEALSDDLIRFLSELGPGIPSGGDVPPPIADICPDPREIRRTVEGDGSLSRSSLGGGGGGEGGGAGAGDGCPGMLLAPFDWALSTVPPRPDVTWAARADGDGCDRVIDVSYDTTNPSRFDLTITLTVTQVPVRGVVKQGTVSKTRRFPTHLIRADANSDGSIDISDVITIVGFLFRGLSMPCWDAADCDDDGEITVTDAVFLAQFLFRGAGGPRTPFPACGADTTPDKPDPGDPTHHLDLGCWEPPSYCGE